jgi:hypothetical protein
MQGKRMPGESARQVAIDVLRSARKPLHTKEITKRVINSGRCSGLKGKTPEATIAAMLAVGSKPGGPFKRVDKGMYALAEPNLKQKSVQPQKRNATPPAKKRQSAKRSVGSSR